MKGVKIDRSILLDWVVEALRELGGSGSLIEVSKKIWANHQKDLEEAGDLFYKWQYDFRGAATELRHRNIMAPADEKKLWVLK